MATRSTLLALAPILLAAAGAAQSSSERARFWSGGRALPASDHVLPPGVPTYTVIPMATLSDEHVMGTVFDLDPSFDPTAWRWRGKRTSTYRPVMVGGSATDFVPIGPNTVASF